MEEALKKRVEELGREASQLIEQREQLSLAIQEIEVRLHQISGAIAEFDKILNNKSTE